jgi:hypothetical protein
MAVGQVLEKYDTDRRFPVWGFGAALPPTGAVSHCFSLGANHSSPEVEGVSGILAAYRQASAASQRQLHWSMYAACRAGSTVSGPDWLGSARPLVAAPVRKVALAACMKLSHHGVRSRPSVCIGCPLRRHALPTLKLSGPTLFAPIINTAATIARQAADGPG